jgi:hypothetical protein
MHKMATVSGVSVEAPDVLMDIARHTLLTERADGVPTIMTRIYHKV